MSWTRGCLAAIVVCVLLGGVAGCDSDSAGEPGAGVSALPVGKLLDDTDEKGRRYREIDEKDAPEVGIEVEPSAESGWDVRLTVRNFRFSPAGVKPEAVGGRGTVALYLDGRFVADLRTVAYHLDGELVRRGTHQLTARLYADDRTVWAVDGDPVESTADITASEAESTPASATPTMSPTTSTMSGNGSEARTDTGGSSRPGGKGP
ncbi:hypothetical protein [Streptomyces sp. NPDC002845]